MVASVIASILPLFRYFDLAPRNNDEPSRTQNADYFQSSFFIGSFERIEDRISPCFCHRFAVLIRHTPTSTMRVRTTNRAGAVSVPAEARSLTRVGVFRAPRLLLTKCQRARRETLPDKKFRRRKKGSCGVYVVGLRRVVDHERFSIDRERTPLDCKGPSLQL
jgi:hypothetical protein